MPRRTFAKKIKIKENKKEKIFFFSCDEGTLWAPPERKKFLILQNLFVRSSPFTYRLPLQRRG